MVGYEVKTKGKERVVEAGSDRAFEAWLGQIPCADSASLHPCGQVAAPLDVFLVTDPLETTTRAGIAMQLLTSSGVVVSLETSDQ